MDSILFASDARTFVTRSRIVEKVLSAQSREGESREIRSLFITAVFAGLTLPGLGASRARAEDHPHLHAALYEMRHARAQLKEARHDFGGHRVKALEALDEAILQIDKALKAVGDNAKGIEPGKDVYKGYANFPHIRHALVEAKEARGELKEAAHDYKGHREKAVLALDRVVEQLDRALQHAR